MMQPKTDPLDREIHGKSLREWNKCWKPVEGGFEAKHLELRYHVGLARAVLAGETKYILCATEVGEGIEKGLQRIRGPEQTGNARYGAQTMRKNIKDLELEVLLVGNDRQAAFASKELKRAMVKLHDPEWNRPFARRMKELRSRKES